MSFLKAVEGLHVVLYPADAFYASLFGSNPPLLLWELLKKLKWVMDSVVDGTALGRVEATNRCAHGVVGKAQASSACLAARQALTKGDLVDAAFEVCVPRNLNLCQAVRNR